jgi:O-antigen/teichoic acid export membrane protein
LCWLLGKFVIRLTFGESFSESAASLTILAWALLAGNFRALFTLYLYAYHKEWWVNGILLLGVILQILLGSVWVSSDGLTGAAWAVIISESFVALILGIGCLIPTLSYKPIT